MDVPKFAVIGPKEGLSRDSRDPFTNSDAIAAIAECPGCSTIVEAVRKDCESEDRARRRLGRYGTCGTCGSRVTWRFTKPPRYVTLWRYYVLRVLVAPFFCLTTDVGFRDFVRYGLAPPEEYL